MLTALTPGKVHTGSPAIAAGIPSMRGAVSSKPTRMSIGLDEIVEALRIGAFAGLGWADIKDSSYLSQMGLSRQPPQRVFFAIVWSHADACVVMAVVRLHTEDVREIFVGEEIDPRWFGVDRFEEQTRVAKAIADHHARGIVFPPYEVVVRWLAPGGKPISRVKRLNTIVGYECNSLPEQHRTEISNYALTLAGQNAAITVTIRNAKRRHLIADEFVVDSGIDPLQLRWMEPVENYQS